MLLLFLTLIVSQKIPITSGSRGDQSPIYQNCLHACTRDNCEKDGVAFKRTAKITQDIFCKVLQWSCRDECKYACMWGTVEKFDQIPKFHGKWPIERVMGVQEPASAMSSLLNLYANLHMYSKIRREFPVSRMPLVILWHAFAFVCMNAWVWSAIFHARDNAFTEFMDYACALSMVMALFVAAVARIFHRRRKLCAVLLIVPVFYYITHVQYLYTGRIDYDYNMTVNVVFGVLGGVLWLVYACMQYCAGRRYALSMVAFTLASGAALTLELCDFPPLRRSWDAHSLWHLSTAPLPLLFYRYVIEDLRYLSHAGLYEKLL